MQGGEGQGRVEYSSARRGRAGQGGVLQGKKGQGRVEYSRARYGMVV